tara:strand:+ start:860 stop:1129 length:270 start_codon:yes stop_codon:yes gene_type:complete
MNKQFRIRYTDTMITLEQIKNISVDIMNNNDWVETNEDDAEFRGICNGLKRLIQHLEEIQDEDILSESDYSQLEEQKYHVEENDNEINK